MIRAIEAIIDEHGNVRLLETVSLPSSRRAFVMILDDPADSTTHEASLLSEPVLAQDWNRPEEDAAWSHLQQER
jgi:hypothetical protein